MAREKNDFCLVCGVEKTEENTYTRLDGLYFQSICKECMSKQSAARYIKRMSPEKRQLMLEKHKKYIAEIEAQAKTS